MDLSEVIHDTENMRGDLEDENRYIDNRDTVIISRRNFLFAGHKRIAWQQNDRRSVLGLGGTYHANSRLWSDLHGSARQACCLTRMGPYGNILRPNRALGCTEVERQWRRGVVA